ncbi:MAG: hypothetical protein ACTSVY_11680 [Candidatus Helarchaeota archaeon]
MNKAGIPIYRDFWIEQLKELIESESTVLVAGFLNALTMFATQFNWEPSKIYFKDVKSNRMNFEILFHEEGPFIVAVFLSTYHFRQQVQKKLTLIFDEILIKYTKPMLNDELVELTFEDTKFIREIFINFKEKEIIMDHLKELENFGDRFVSEMDVKGIFCLSQDGELLWNSNQMRKQQIEVLLDKVQVADLSDFDEGQLFNMVIDKISGPLLISEIKSEKFPFIYGLICDINSSLGPVSAKLQSELNDLFSSN